MCSHIFHFDTLTFSIINYHLCDYRDLGVQKLDQVEHTLSINLENNFAVIHCNLYVHFTVTYNQEKAM